LIKATFFDLLIKATFLDGHPSRAKEPDSGIIFRRSVDFPTEQLPPAGRVGERHRPIPPLRADRLAESAARALADVGSAVSIDAVAAGVDLVGTPVPLVTVDWAPVYRDGLAAAIVDAQTLDAYQRLLAEVAEDDDEALLHGHRDYSQHVVS
jgi:hypothetical protein